MNFTDKTKSDAFNFSGWELPEIRSAIFQNNGWIMPGLTENNQRAKDLARTLRESNQTGAAIVYVTAAAKISTRVVTPFNLQTQLAERYPNYECNDHVMKVEKLELPIKLGFVSYVGKIPELQKLLPNVKIMPFDMAFAINVNVVGSATKYVYERGIGKVIALSPPNPMYGGAPSNGAAIACEFHLGIGGSVSRSGVEWCHFLYHKFLPTRDGFMETVAARMPMSEVVLTGDPPKWTRTFDWKAWNFLKPKDDAERIEALNTMQQYRSKDNAGISACTYAAYGEEFSTQYRLVEKISNFRAFLDALPKFPFKTQDGQEIPPVPLRYATRDERELAGVIRELALMKMNVQLVHFLGHTVDGVPSSVEGKYDFTDAIVYDPTCCTMPFSGKLLPGVIAEYKKHNVVLYQQKMSKFKGAAYIGLRAHVLGLERHVMYMAAPHNAVAVMSYDCKLYSETAIWNTIMAAGLVRNTFLYHRKSFSYFMTQIGAMNHQAEQAGEEPHSVMQWQTMRRPPYCAFTKEQRKRMISVIRESSMFGKCPDDITDFDLADLVEKAQQQPKLLKKLLEKRAEPDSDGDDVTKPKGSVLKTIQRMQDVVGDDMEDGNGDPPERVDNGDSSGAESDSSSYSSDTEAELLRLKKKAADRKRKKKGKKTKK
jgi:hypothetical protein